MEQIHAKKDTIRQAHVNALQKARSCNVDMARKPSPLPIPVTEKGYLFENATSISEHQASTNMSRSLRKHHSDVSMCTVSLLHKYQFPLSAKATNTVVTRNCQNVTAKPVNFKSVSLSALKTEETYDYAYAHSTLPINHTIDTG